MSYITNQARFISLISTSLLFACGDSDKQNLNSSSNDGSQPSSETSTEPSVMLKSSEKIYNLHYLLSKQNDYSLCHFLGEAPAERPR